MNDEQVLDYVKAAAALAGLPMDEARAKRVAAHLARSAELAALVQAAALDLEDEPAEVYRPAPFPDLEAPQ